MHRVLGLFLVAALAACSSKTPDKGVTHRDVDLAYSIELPAGWSAAGAQGDALVSFKTFRPGGEIMAMVLAERTRAAEAAGYWELLRPVVVESGGVVDSVDPFTLAGRPGLRIAVHGDGGGQTMRQMRYLVVREGWAFQVMVTTLGAEPAGWQAALAEIESGVRWLPGTPKRGAIAVKHADTHGGGWILRDNQWLSVTAQVRIDMGSLTTTMGSPEVTAEQHFIGVDPVLGATLELSSLPLPTPAARAGYRAAVVPATQLPPVKASLLGKPIELTAVTVPVGRALIGFTEHAGRWLKVQVVTQPGEGTAATAQAVLDRIAPLTLAEAGKARRGLVLDERRWVADGVDCFRRVCRDAQTRLQWTLPAGAWNLQVGAASTNVPGGRIIGFDHERGLAVLVLPWGGAAGPEPLAKRIQMGTGAVPDGTIRFGEQTLPVLKVVQGGHVMHMVPIEQGENGHVAQVVMPDNGRSDAATVARGVLNGLAPWTGSRAGRTRGKRFEAPAFGVAVRLPPDLRWKAAPGETKLTQQEFGVFFGTTDGMQVGFVRGVGLPFPSQAEAYFEGIMDALRREIGVGDSTPKERRLGTYRVRSWGNRFATFGLVEGPGVSLLVQARGQAEWDRVVDGIEFLDD